jgi:hypothetical protein
VHDRVNVRVNVHFEISPKVGVANHVASVAYNFSHNVRLDVGKVAHKLSDKERRIFMRVTWSVTQSVRY